MQATAVKAVKKKYEPPALRKLAFNQVKTFVLNHTREFLELIFPGRANPNSGPSPSSQQGKHYEPPGVRKLTPEQAKLLLIGHASVGDQGAKDILELCFPEPNSLEEKSM